MRRLARLEPSHRTDALLQLPVVGLQPVIEEFYLTMLAGWRQATFLA